jgi:predicted DNA-binding transcriptional regulator YafY
MRRLLAAIRRTIRAALTVSPALAAIVLGPRYALRAAVVHGWTVVITYRKEDGTESVRTVEPHKVWETKAGNWAVRAHDRIRGEDRTFRIDRITAYRLAA